MEPAEEFFRGTGVLRAQHHDFRRRPEKRVECQQHLAGADGVLLHERGSGAQAGLRHVQVVLPRTESSQPQQQEDGQGASTGKRAVGDVFLADQERRVIGLGEVEAALVAIGEAVEDGVGQGRRGVDPAFFETRFVERD